MQGCLALLPGGDASKRKHFYSLFYGLKGANYFCDKSLYSGIVWRITVSLVQSPVSYAALDPPKSGLEVPYHFMHEKCG